jgi:hypothetical protein
VLNTILGTLPFTQVARDPAPVLLGAALFVRGIGFGAVSIAVVTAA